MDVGRLIECVRKHVFLYDLCHKDYKNPSLKSDTWEFIARELNESGETCRLKWKTVRDGYIKYKKQLKSAKGSSKKEIDYIWRSKLSFLDNHKATRRSFYKTDPYRKSNSFPSMSKQVDGSKSQDESTSTLSVSPSPLVPFGSLTTLPKVGSTSFQANKDSPREIHDQDNFRDYREISKNIDSTDHLFLSYSGTFKTFSLRQQALLKIKLAKLFANAELEQLENVEYSGVRVPDDCSPLIIKTEYTELRDSESDISVDLNDGTDDAIEEKPANRSRRRAATPRQ